MNLPQYFIRRVKQLGSKKTLVYVALGDSTVEGIGASSTDYSYPALISRHLSSQYSVQYYNLGVRGSKSKDILKSQLQRAIELQPDLVTISLGGNDIFKNVRTKEFERNLRTILYRLQHETNAFVVMNNIPNFKPVTAFPKLIKAYCQLRRRRLNWVIQSVSIQTQTVMVDMYHFNKAFEKNRAELLSFDGLHPSDRGYELWAEAVLPYIEGLHPSHNLMAEDLSPLFSMFKPDLIKSFFAQFVRRLNTLPARSNSER